METEICHNCKREVPQANYLMHVAHCARNMVVCPVCGDAFPKTRLKEHREEQHAMVECPDCRFKVQSAAMASHRATACGRRVAPCAYCALELPRTDLQEHETYCGARTERCNDCGELVMLKYQQLHLDSNHGFLKLHDEPGPAPSWESSSPLSRGVVNDLPSRSNEINVTSQQPALNKIDYKRPTLGDEPTPALSPRDTPRTLITPYDASEDLRAKVKLARHDLNEIKHSFMLNEERREPAPSVPLYRAAMAAAAAATTTAPPSRPRDKFVTNLVPYEKHESYKVNARNLDEPRPGGFYNYLGAKEPVQDAANLVSLTNTAPKFDLADMKLKSKNNKALAKATQKTELNGRNKLDLSTRNTFHQENEAATTDKVTEKPAFSETSSKIPRSPKNTGALPKKTASCNGTVPKRQDGNKAVRRKAPPPPIEAAKLPEVAPSVLHELDADEDEVRLPCEFCEKMVPASRLVLHETGCRPDLAQIQTRAEESRSTYSGSSPDVQLPCEFCLQLVPASKLLSHQALCDV